MFSGITPDQYASLLQKAQKAGMSLSGNSRTALKFGVEVAWNYSPAAQQLTFHACTGPSS
jgi:hypothetical protein